MPGRLENCIRDLAALNALPSMCIGRSPDEALAIVLDALPTALSADILFLELPGAPPKQRAVVAGVLLSDASVAAVKAALDAHAGAAGATELPGVGAVWCNEAEVPFRAGCGRLVAGRRTPNDRETDRVLVRSAANLVGSTLENANVLDAARRKDDFLAILGHELRNPLAPIMTAVELLKRHVVANREQEIIERNTRHIVRLVDDLLDISRVTRGHVELRREQVTLTSVLERATELAGPQLTRQRHRLFVADAAGVTLQGDAVRLAQVFGNLLTNAAKFTPPNGKIEILIERASSSVRVAVRDDGRGIRGDQLERIFEPFVQAEREPDALRGGLGLGLAIVSNLVERHGGNIAVHSDGPGRGATFTVELPTVTPAPQPADSRPAQAPRARAGVRVLVVDDNADLAELLSEALRYEGFQTDVAHNASDALARWQSFGPHAAILDVCMPEVDGYELARKLRSEHGTHLTLIAATGYGQHHDRVRAADAGFDCHFVKPVRVDALVLELDQRVLGGAAES